MQSLIFWTFDDVDDDNVDDDDGETDQLSDWQAIEVLRPFISNRGEWLSAATHGA